MFRRGRALGDLMSLVAKRRLDLPPSPPLLDDDEVVDVELVEEEVLLAVVDVELVVDDAVLLEDAALPLDDPPPVPSIVRGDPLHEFEAATADFVEMLPTTTQRPMARARRLATESLFRFMERLRSVLDDVVDGGVLGARLAAACGCDRDAGDGRLGVVGSRPPT